MVPAPCPPMGPVPPPAYQHALTTCGPALHIDALTLVTYLHLLALCRLAVQQPRCRYPSPLPQGPGGALRCHAQVYENCARREDTRAALTKDTWR